MKKLNEYESLDEFDEVEEQEETPILKKTIKSNQPSLSKSNFHTVRAESERNQELFDLGLVSCWWCGDKGNSVSFDMDINREGDMTIVDEYALKVEKCPICNGIGLQHTIKLDSFLTLLDFQKKAKEKALDYIEDHRSGWYWFAICGQVGSGKSHLTEAIKNELIDDYSYQTIKIKFTEEAAKLKSVVNDPQYMDRIAQLQRVKLLVIDDLFQSVNDEKPSSADVKIAKLILDYRYEKQMMTIINSEFTLAEITRDIDGSIGTRIYERTDSNRFYVQIEEKQENNMRVHLKKLLSQFKK